jgi:hypothetical protein
MKNEAPSPQEETMVTLEGTDGNTYSCHILNIFPFEKKEYALLLKAGESKESSAPKESDEDNLVIMRLVERDGQSIFQYIEDDDEFDRVVSHVEELARQAEAEMSQEETG